MGAAALTLVALASCSGETGSGVGEGAPPSASAAAPSATAPGGAGTPATGASGAVPETTATARPDVRGVALETVVDGLDQPVDVTTGPEAGALYIVERPGRVRIADLADDGTATVRDAPYLDITGQVSTGGERGLLGIAFDPDGDWLYGYYTDPEGTSTLSAWDLAAGGPSDEQVLMTVPQPYSNHNGGELAFGPDDLLWWGLGDGGAGGDPQGNGQNPRTLLGAILRIEPAPGTADGYTIPEDNPFADGEDGAAEVWAYGLRNPWRFAFDPSGEELWIGDVGQDAVEEINRIAVDRAGANFGWAALEGNEPFAGSPPQDAVAPVSTYTHAEGQSVTGGRVAEAPAALAGWYVFGDFASGFVRALDPQDPSRVVELPVEVPALVDFGAAPDGTLLAVSIGGSVQRFTGDG